jgi:uncharacterized protein with FMN-binding domain
MRRITLALAATSTGIALVVGLKAQSAGAPRPALAVGSGRVGGAAQPHSTASPTAPGSGGSSGGRTAATLSGRFTGPTIGTRYGPVQVEAVLAAGKLTDVVVLQETDGGRSRAIDSYALPVLRTEALAAQGANIDVVSGATYTSSGYAQSLQAALDKAGRG